MTQRYYSQIYWHFTGSPKGINWSKVREPRDILQQGTICNSDEATGTLKKILSSRTLLATAVEAISNNIKTEKFCCVTDIPLKDLLEHTRYYGRAAIGFNAKAIHKKFLPVFYIPEENLPIKELLVSPTFEEAMTALKNKIGWPEKDGEPNYHLLRGIGHPQPIKKTQINENELIFFKNYLKITNFSTNPDQTFYREREWRHLNDFLFLPDDVAAVIVDEKYLSEVRHYADKLGFPQEMSILSWEFVTNA